MSHVQVYLAAGHRAVLKTRPWRTSGMRFNSYVAARGKSRANANSVKLRFRRRLKRRPVRRQNRNQRSCWTGGAPLVAAKNCRRGNAALEREQGNQGEDWKLAAPHSAKRSGSEPAALSCKLEAAW